MIRVSPLFLLSAALSLACTPLAYARTIYRCVQDGTISLATAPEPASKCEPREVDDNAATVPNLWGVNGQQSGVLFQLEQKGRTVYSTRELPGSTRVLAFTVSPPNIPAHPGLGFVSRPRTDIHAPLFVAAAKANELDDAWLRAIAHAESNFRSDAISPKGAEGVMQLMPETASLYRVKDSFSPKDSIAAGARHLAKLLRLYGGDRRLAAAAYNAGEGAVALYKGVPPYAETQAYVGKVEALYALYQTALSAPRVSGTKSVHPALGR